MVNKSISTKWWRYFSKNEHGFTETANLNGIATLAKRDKKYAYIDCIDYVTRIELVQYIYTRYK